MNLTKKRYTWISSTQNNQIKWHACQEVDNKVCPEIIGEKITDYN